VLVLVTKRVAARVAARVVARVVALSAGRVLTGLMWCSRCCGR